MSRQPLAVTVPSQTSDPIIAGALVLTSATSEPRLKFTHKDHGEVTEFGLDQMSRLLEEQGRTASGGGGAEQRSVLWRRRSRSTAVEACTVW